MHGPQLQHRLSTLGFLTPQFRDLLADDVGMIVDKKVARLRLVTPSVFVPLTHGVGAGRPVLPPNETRSEEREWQRLNKATID